MGEAKPIPLGELTAALFEKYRGQEFLLIAEEDPSAPPVLCDLVEVSRAPRFAKSQLQREPFSLLFRGMQDRTLAQGLHTLRAGPFEVHNLFLCRIQLLPQRPEESGCAFYEAVFS